MAQDNIQLRAILSIEDAKILSRVTKKISQAVAGIDAGPAAAVTKVTKDLTAAQGALNNQLTAGEKAGRLFLSRMAQFAILLPTFATLNKAIQGSVKFLFDFDSALRDIIRLDPSVLADQMEAIGDAALETAKEFGESATLVLELTKTFQQAGFTITESQDKARAAILATQVSTLKATDAVELFIAAEKQFGAEGKNAISVLDKVSKAEDVSASEAQDIADAFRTGGNALAEFSKSLDDSIGIIAALREQTRKSGSEIGTFLKTIQTRIFAAGDARDALEALGVEVENLDGTLRPTKDVLNDTKAAFDGLTEAQTANAAKAIAGVRQFESLIAVINSIDRANEISRASSAAAGTADEKRRITDEKLERQIGKLIAQGQEFAAKLGEAGLQDLLSNVLKITNGILQAFTKLVDVTGGIGGNIAPLLALGGVALGRGIFGLAGGKAPKAPGAGGPGDIGIAMSDFIGPLRQGQQQISTFGQQFVRIGTIFKESSLLATNGLKSLATTLQVSSQGTRIDTTSLQQHTAAIKQNIAALQTSEKLALQRGGGGLKGAATSQGARFGATLLGATVLPQAFDFLAKHATNAGEGLAKLGVVEKLANALGKSPQQIEVAVGGTASSLADAAGGAATMAATFALMPPPVIAAAAAFGLLSKVIPNLIQDISDESAAKEELSKLSEEEAKVRQGQINLLTKTPEALEAQAKLLADLFKATAETAPGKERAKGIATGLQQFAGSNEARKAELDNVELLRRSLFSNINVIKGLIGNNEEYIRSVAESSGRTSEFTELMNLLANATDADAGEAIRRLIDVASEVAPILDEATGALNRINISFAEFKDIQSVQELADSVRTMGLELELAQLGPDALTDSVVKMQQELLLAERAFEQTAQGTQESLSAITDLFNEAAPAGEIAGMSMAEFFNFIKEGVNSIDSSSIEEFNQTIKNLPTSQRKASEELIKIFEKQLGAEIEIQNKRNQLQDEQNQRQKALLEAETEAARNAQTAMEGFNAELKQFGDNVSQDLIQQFAGLSTTDIKAALDPSVESDLSADLKELIQNAFAGPVVEAERDLAVSTATTQAEVAALNRELDIINQKLSDQANANEFAALTAEKHKLELDIETTTQKGLVDTIKAKIKIIEEEKKAAEALAEAEKKRKEALEKLADASRSLDKEIRDVNRAFEEFQTDKIQDLLDKETDARSELADAQKEVIDSLAGLDEAYKSLVQAQLEFNAAITEAKIKSNLLARDIAFLTGEVVTFDQQFSSLTDSFNEALRDSNITLAKRIELEQQLAEETLNFLRQARDEIVQAGVGIFGQTAQENQGLAQGIQGLQFIAEQLGGSFENFLNLDSSTLADLSDRLLNLPVEFRQQILDALSFLPNTTNIGGFSPEQLRQAIGQIGAGVAPEAGLPSIEELNNQQVEQLNKLRELAVQEAQLQITQVLNAERQVELAEEQLDAAQIAEERAREDLGAVRDAVFEENSILNAANQERRELLNAVMAADDRNTLQLIEQEAQLFAEQNQTFRDVGDQIVRGIGQAINARLAVLEAAANVNNAAMGYIPNYAGGNLSPREASGLLQAAMREKRRMPGGARLAVANTREAIIPMSRGYVPNFQDGNVSPISAGIAAIKAINETVVAAIARSVTEALADLDSGKNNSEILQNIVDQLAALNSTLEDVSESNQLIQSNTSTAPAGGIAAVTTPATAQDVNITLQTNQNNTVTITGLESLREQIRSAVLEVATNQVDEQLALLLDQLDAVFTALSERGIINSIGTTR